MKPLRYLSLFSGIEACSVAWAPLGWECVGVAEIEPFPAAVLKHHYPNVPNLGDVTKITAERLAELGPIDVVVGGSPCQDLSAAGKRAGLAGARSGLFFEQVRIFDAARSVCGARWLLWENVPGAFSTNGGRDFALVVSELAGSDFGVPRGGWGSEGMALGPRGLVEWSVLDAQFFNLAQRRERVFAVLDTGNWPSRSPVLLEPESIRGNLATHGEKTRQETAPGTLRTDGSDREQRTEQSPCLITLAHGQGGAEIGYDLCPTLTCNHEAPIVAKVSPLPDTGAQVRRLTPRECERLQGFPDDYTLIPMRGKPAADGPRYKALGNSMAVPVMRWIGRQIQRAHDESTPEENQP